MQLWVSGLNHQTFNLNSKENHRFDSDRLHFNKELTMNYDEFSTNLSMIEVAIVRKHTNSRMVIQINAEKCAGLDEMQKYIDEIYPGWTLSLEG